MILLWEGRETRDWKAPWVDYTKNIRGSYFCCPQPITYIESYLQCLFDERREIDLRAKRVTMECV
jgi:hypothetical protein